MSIIQGGSVSIRNNRRLQKKSTAFEKENLLKTKSPPNGDLIDGIPAYLWYKKKAETLERRAYIITAVTFIATAVFLAIWWMS